MVKRNTLCNFFKTYIKLVSYQYILEFFGKSLIFGAGINIVSLGLSAVIMSSFPNFVVSLTSL